MSAPDGFSWVDRPDLAALSWPTAPEDLVWLRAQGIELVVSLLSADGIEKERSREIKRWIEDASLLVFTEPFDDMEAPSPEQLDRVVGAIERAISRGMSVAVHCRAGLGRTGVVLAAYFVKKGLSAHDAINRVRRLRPGSIETVDQEVAIEDFERRHRPVK